MLKIFADRKDREMVQEVAAEYIGDKFHELKGDYEALNLRIDRLASELTAVSKMQAQTQIKVSEIEDSMADVVAETKQQVEDALNTLNLELVRELEYRVDDLEHRNV